MEKNRVELFVNQVRAKLNLNLFWRILIWSAAVAAGALVFVGLGYIIQGYAVPRGYYLLGAVLSGLSAVGVWFFRRLSKAAASQYADEHFGLKDAVTSCRNFAGDGKTGGYFDLQAGQTNERIQRLDSSAIPFTLPTRTLAVAIVLGMTAILMAFRGPSKAVLDQLALQVATMDQTTAMNKQLEELVDELEKEIEDEEERELVEPNKLREWVKELKQTEDQKEALRQYAKLEQKMQKAAAKLQQKRDEQYLERAAKELEKGEETKKLAKTLEQKKYDDAAKELRKMQPEETKPLSEQRKQLARLKAAAKRMAAAAKSSKRQKSKSSPKQSNNQKTAKSSKNAGNNSTNPSQAQGQMAESQGSSQQNESVEELVEDLEMALEDLDLQLAKAEMMEREAGECDKKMLGECKACMGKAGKSMSKLGKKLARMSMKKKLQSKFASLCQACSQCQSNCASLCQSPNPGGKKAGWGSSDTVREERDPLVDNGQYTQLKGIKGEGPSIASVEEAEDGTGVSTIRGTAVARSFERQMESFVEREDVPDDVKSGVRNYFEMIHQAE